MDDSFLTFILWEISWTLMTLAYELSQISFSFVQILTILLTV